MESIATYGVEEDYMGIKIKPEQLNGTTVLVGIEISDAHAREAVKDDSGDKLLSCTQTINSTAKDLGDTVSKYSEFLNKIANEFKNTDYKISTKIQNDKSYISDGKVNPSDDYFSTK